MKLMTAVCLVIVMSQPGLGQNTPPSTVPASSISISQESSVRTSTGEITLPTYPWQQFDDINPHFRWTGATIYPYPMQDNLSKTKVNKTYKTLVLENEYLKVTVIPELGGHVHSVLDKFTGESMLYENKVIKPALIGLRGAWVSGGIEFNTGPQGHTVTCLSPVEAKFVDYDDGSKAIAIGNVEQVYHTQWVAVVRLRPGRSFLEERIRIYNPTGNRHPYYFWNCVAVPNTNGTQFIYPMTLGTDHAGTTFFTWPIHEGKDLSWAKNFRDPTSIFAYRCDQDFYGSYDHDLDRGVIGHANHYELSGKKSWTWGRGTWGLRAQESLTDDGSFYNEIQTGPLPTQADFGVLEPHQTIEWKEWWYPVRGTRGVAFSNKDVTANVLIDEKNKTMTVLLHGTAISNVTCSVEGLGEQKAKITPEHSTSVTFPMKGNRAPFHITVSGERGVLAQFTYPLPLPVRTPPQNPRALPSGETAAGCWLRGVHYDKEGSIYAARGWFEKALQKDPNFAPAHTALGELDLEAGQYDAAQARLETSLQLNPEDGWAAYYLAQALLEKGLIADALEITYHATRHLESAAAAYSFAGAIFLRQGEFARALDPLHKALEYNANDLVTRDLLAYALWKSGYREEAEEELQKVQDRDPLDMPSAIIAGMMGKEDKEFIERIGGRREEVLDAADFFLTAGLQDEAVQVLERYYFNPDLLAKEVDPLPYYTYGVLTNDSKRLAQAMEMSPDYVFPNRRSSFMILEEAIRRQPNDWKAHYYLGNLYFERCRKEDVLRVWNQAMELGGSYSVLYRNLGLVAWRLDANPWKAIAFYEKAISANPNDLPLYRDLGRIYFETGQYVKARELLERARDGKRPRADLTALLGQTYLRLGEYEKTIDLLAADSYVNWEGQGSLYDIHSEAHIRLGEQLFQKGDYANALKEFQTSLTAPKNLGPGKMGETPEAVNYYWIGMAYERLGKKEDAVRAWKRAAEEINRGDERNRKFAREADQHGRKLK